jgi:hypothetical protein
MKTKHKGLSKTETLITLKKKNDAAGKLKSLNEDCTTLIFYFHTMVLISLVHYILLSMPILSPKGMSCCLFLIILLARPKVQG